jgi:uncharacterized protein (TIGR03435 family)
MRKSCKIIDIGRKRFQYTAEHIGIAAAIVIGLFGAPGANAQTQAQATAAPAAASATGPTTTAPTYEYEVASIKLNKSGNAMPGVTMMDDGINLTNIPLRALVIGAFGVGNDQISGLPEWLTSERYDINAKMDASVYEALKKLSPDDRAHAQQEMLLALFADRCKMTFHRETKELPTITLVVAKNGPKFHETKAGDASSEGVKVPDGQGGTGTVQVGEKGLMTFHGLPLAMLVRVLSAQLGRTVVDKTGLTGKYDFTWQFTSDAEQLRKQSVGQPTSGGAMGGGGLQVAADPEGTSLFTAVQEELGLKLEAGKSPVQVIVIDHIERPSGN